MPALSFDDYLKQKENEAQMSFGVQKRNRIKN